jgi:ABC-type polysaccharide/polyol phosphate transport system ATPase subunit
MSDVVIRAEGLGKKYVIGHETGERYTALRDVLAQQARRLVRSARDMAAGRALIAGDEREEFWALRDVNFEIRRGEVVGIIGRNGAGKSTLLKVLSRITEPTEGRVTIDGRVASLLEVGTGFHPELTGRENIYLNGAILGMTRAEIRRKFDEIVDFAGVEKFLDTPVKRYSSGMYVRLAFSVAAHLEPEILVVDEVLAVGDAEFQKKCLGKMQDVAGQGGRCCSSVITHHFAIYDDDRCSPKIFEAARPIFVEFQITQKRALKSPRITLIVIDEWGEIVFASTDEAARSENLAEAGTYRISAMIPKNTFNTSKYIICLRMSSGGRAGFTTLIDTVQLAEIEVECTSAHGSLRNEGKSWPGPVVPEVLWNHVNL